MRRISDTRLARVARTTPPRDLTALRHRALLRARAAVSALLSQCSGRPDAGRALAGALALGEAAALELAAIPDGADLRRRDEAGLARDHPGVAEAFAARVQEIMWQYRQGREVDPATASPAELLSAFLAAHSPFPPCNASTLPPPAAEEG
jgi:hypothetical protein